jgi:hypothetical protein
MVGPPPVGERATGSKTNRSGQASQLTQSVIEVVRAAYDIAWDYLDRIIRRFTPAEFF